MGRVLVLIICVPFIAAALLTPPIYSALVVLWPGLPWPFPRVFSRVAMLVVPLLLFHFRRELDLHRLKEYFRPVDRGRRFNLKMICMGTLLSLFAAGLFFPLILGYGKIDWGTHSPSRIALGTLGTLPVALLVATIEESFFRVILFGWLAQRRTALFAAVATSVLYAVLHFVAPVKEFTYAAFSPFAGFDYLSRIFERMLHPEVLPGLIGLFLVGLVLCYAIHTTRSIYLVIGLHAGWIVAVKMSSIATVLAPGMEFSAALGRRYYLVSTPWGWASVLFVWAALLLSQKTLGRAHKEAPK